MLSFIKANIATIIVLIIVALLVFLAIRKIVKDKKSNKGGCSQNCSGCPYSNNCNK